MSFKDELQKRGAREFQIAALSSDEDRAMTAIATAEKRNAGDVIAYALALFDDPTWTGRGKLKPQSTNLHVDTKCHACDGDLFVPVTEGLGAYEETYAPCKVCNPKANTERWVGRERRTTAAR